MEGEQGISKYQHSPKYIVSGLRISGWARFVIHA